MSFPFAGASSEGIAEISFFLRKQKEPQIGEESEDKRKGATNKKSREENSFTLLLNENMLISWIVERERARETGKSLAVGFGKLFRMLHVFVDSRKLRAIYSQRKCFRLSLKFPIDKSRSGTRWLFGNRQFVSPLMKYLVAALFAFNLLKTHRLFIAIFRLTLNRFNLPCQIGN